MIDELRERIDVIDEQLVALLNTRAACALEIGKLKRERGLPIYQPEREADVIRRARAAAAYLGGPLTEDAISRLFERIIDEARQLEIDGGGDRGSGGGGAIQAGGAGT